MIAICAAGKKTGSTSSEGSLSAEIGPKDIAKGSVFVGRRDTGEKQGIPREQFLTTAVETLRAMQAGLYARALALRQAHTRRIDDLDEFRQFFTPANGENPEDMLNYDKFVEKLSAGAMHSAAKKYFDTGNMVKVILFPEKK